jgi:hypothetical protein
LLSAPSALRPAVSVVWGWFCFVGASGSAPHLTSPLARSFSAPPWCHPTPATRSAKYVAGVEGQPRVRHGIVQRRGLEAGRRLLREWSLLCVFVSHRGWRGHLQVQVSKRGAWAFFFAHGSVLDCGSGMCVMGTWGDGAAVPFTVSRALPLLLCVKGRVRVCVSVPPVAVAAPTPPRVPPPLPTCVNPACVAFLLPPPPPPPGGFCARPPCPRARHYKWSRENKFFQLCNADSLAVGGGGAFALYLVRCAACCSREPAPLLPHCQLCTLCARV